MINRLHFIFNTIRQYQYRWLITSLLITVLYYILLLAAVMIKFGSIPNYVRTYDWTGNVIRIFQSTPSFSDSLSIIRDEWIFEIGYMNYDFGIGLSEWSLYFVPIKILGVFLLSAFAVTYVMVIKARRKTCKFETKPNTHRLNQIMGTTGAGTVAIASTSLSWVVCCSTPTWVVGLAMLGLGVNTSLFIEPIGGWLNIIGYGLLATAVYFASPALEINRENLVNTK